VDGSSTGTGVPRKWALLRPHNSEEPNMQTVTTVGLGIASLFFRDHGIDAKGDVIIRRQIKRRHVLAGRRGSKKTV
jgi:hypothetical protein